VEKEKMKRSRLGAERLRSCAQKVKSERMLAESGVQAKEAERKSAAKDKLDIINT
jgi:hypothetical protein